MKKLRLILIICITFVVLYGYFSFYYYEKNPTVEYDKKVIEELNLNNKSEKISNVIITYDLDDKEMIIAKSWIDQIKTEYLEMQDSITITRNKSLVMNKEKKLRGVNFGNGEIYVLYRNDTKDTKRTLQHEILHSLFTGLEKGKEEWFVRDIDDHNLIYKTDIVPYFKK